MKHQKVLKYENDCSYDGQLQDIAVTCLWAIHLVNDKLPVRSWLQGFIQNPIKYLRWSFFSRIVHLFQPLIIFAKDSISDVRLGF